MLHRLAGDDDVEAFLINDIADLALFQGKRGGGDGQEHQVRESDAVNRCNECGGDAGAELRRICEEISTSCSAMNLSCHRRKKTLVETPITGPRIVTS